MHIYPGPWVMMCWKLWPDFRGSGDEVVYAEFAFAVYAVATRVSSVLAVVVPREGLGHDLDAMAAAITAKNKLIYWPIPTTRREPVLIIRASNVPGARAELVLVVLDGAY